MKLRSVGIAVLFASVLLGFSHVAAGREPPVAKLVQVEGNVQYSRNGATWRPVRHTKYLFPGYQIKTGDDGGGKLINEGTGMSQALGANSLIKVEGDSIAVLEGSLSKPTKESTSIFQSLANKFAKAQRYTTVRRNFPRGDDQQCNNKVPTIRKVTLSPSHPDLVWRNACPEYSYRLIIEGKAHDIPAQSTSEMIRYTVTGLKPGEYSYHVEVLDKDGTIYIPRKDSAFVLLSAKQEGKLLKQLDQFGDDVFLKTNLFESNDMHVAAMDAYREYFQANPDDNEMRPLLIQSYQELKLSDLRDDEARLYNASLEEE